MFADFTTFAVPFTVINILAPLAEVLCADQVWNMQLSRFGLPRILRAFKVVEYVQYSVAWRQHILQLLHITYFANLSLRVAHVTVALIAFVWFSRNDEFAACHTISLALTDGFLFPIRLL